jgi:hypothetical protein
MPPESGYGGELVAEPIWQDPPVAVLLAIIRWWKMIT